ncbi:MAG: YicC family protein [Deltaproteobacteria bacterium]|nr:YicC family protein [Deltaproteobacteria bacterium]
MTGYGEASRQVRGTKITIQVRSLNHRHLDLQLRVPREYLSFEEEIRRRLRERITRGRVDLFVNRFAAKGTERMLELDEALLRQYLGSIRTAKKKFRLAGDLDVALLTSGPDLFQVRDKEVDAKAEKEAVFHALQSALLKLDQSRRREGRQLAADMESHIVHLTKTGADIEARAAEIGTRLVKASIVVREGDAAPRGEKDGEVSTWAFKGDINEEVVRLKTHVAALAAALREAGPVGKKIDFMLQEIQRELNTISSKMPQLEVVQLVLAGKGGVEKIREQTQNIE